MDVADGLPFYSAYDESFGAETFECFHTLYEAAVTVHSGPHQYQAQNCWNRCYGYRQ